MKFLIVLVAVVVLVGMLSASWRRLTGKTQDRSRSAQQRSNNSSAAQGGAIQAMRACAHCGVHMPESDMVLHEGRAYCSLAHRHAGPRDRPGSGGADS
jgi:uncharacterized protein